MSPELLTQIHRGRPSPLGATVVDGGCNFAVFSPKATQIEICLFDVDDREALRIKLPARSGGIWYGFIPGVGYGQKYGIRASGAFEPHQGLFFNPNKLLIDPYAQSISKKAVPSNLFYAHDRDNREDMTPCLKDSAPQMTKSVVTDQSFDWQGTQSPKLKWNNTVIYEAHVKGFTMNFPHIPDELRGTYLGMAHPAVISYIKQLGMTTIQLMPVFSFMTEPRLRDLSLSNYWGYNPINFFSPDPRYALKDPVSELKTLVREYHKAGLEVVLDVVYNHTAEGSIVGQTLSYRGLDPGFYRYHPDDRTHYVDDSGCGNSVNVYKAHVLRMVMDSMRHWVTHYHIDGFRFDLAVSLAREEWDFSRSSTFFKVISQDPVLHDIKLIAEPWDMGRNGYQLGQFPEEWYEINDKFRDSVRAFWLTDSADLADFATRIMGSRELFRKGVQEISASLNMITCHDGFTLEDLVSYQQKHNQLNQERNRDGHNANYSANHGEEGVTANPDILELRSRQKRNLLATLLLSQGSVHFLAGDEICRTQKGNNNAYCQDNELNYLDWQIGISQRKHLEFVRQLIKIRSSSQLFGDLVFNPEQLKHGPAHSDEVHWFNLLGKPMEIANWHDKNLKAGMLLISKKIQDPQTELVSVDECFLIMVNAHSSERECVIPAGPMGGWKVILDTGEDDGMTPPDFCLSEDIITLKAKTLLLLSHPEWSVNPD